MRNISGVKKAVKNAVRSFIYEEDGMGVVEVVLIIIVLVGLVALFKDQIESIVKTVLSKMSTKIKQI